MSTLADTVLHAQDGRPNPCALKRSKNAVVNPVDTFTEHSLQSMLD